MDYIGTTQKVERLVQGHTVLFAADPQSLYAVPLGTASGLQGSAGSSKPLTNLKTCS